MNKRIVALDYDDILIFKDIDEVVKFYSCSKEEVNKVLCGLTLSIKLSEKTDDYVRLFYMDDFITLTKKYENWIESHLTY